MISEIISETYRVGGLRSGRGSLVYTCTAYVTTNMAATVARILRPAKNLKNAIFAQNIGKIQSKPFSNNVSCSSRANFFPARTESMLPKGCFEGKVAFVTGGGTGLGKGMVKKLSELGAAVVITSRYCRR